MNDMTNKRSIEAFIIVAFGLTVNSFAIISLHMLVEAHLNIKVYAKDVGY